MAKTRRSTKEREPFAFQTVSAKDAETMRSRRGKRRSKYSTVGEQFDKLDKDQVLVFEASKNEVQGVRNYMRRNYDESHHISSRHKEGDTFDIFIAKTA